MPPLIEIQGLVRAYGSLRALDHLDLRVAAGELVAVTGPSGSGKTTLLNILAGLDRPTSGRVAVDGTDLGTLGAKGLALYRRQTIGLVFQQFHLIPYLTAVENVMLAQYLHSMTDRAEAAAALQAVGLGARLDHLPAELSGGEQQRVCIARALVNRPKIVLADEPTGNLDGVNEAVVMGLLEDLHRQGHTLVLVTHDPTIAARAAREIRLEHGRLAATPEPDAAAHRLLLAELWRQLEEDRERVAVERRGVAEAIADGRLQYSGGNLRFTETGRRLAIAAVRELRLGEALFAHALGRDSAQGAGAAPCGRAPALAPAVVDQVCTFLGHPAACPHGRPIPRGEGCCPVEERG